MLKLTLKTLDQWAECVSDVSKAIFVPVYRFGRQNFGKQKNKYDFIYTDIFYYRLCYFHCKPFYIMKTSSLEGLHPTDGHQHFDVILHYSLSKTICCVGNSMPKKPHWYSPLCSNLTIYCKLWTHSVINLVPLLLTLTM